MKQVLFLILMVLSSVIWAQEEVALEHANVNIHDKQSILRGAKFFSSVCMACHTLVYLRYDQLAQKAGVTYEKMPTKVTQWPNGIVPPDLSLEVSRRGADWIYTYLHSFYYDPKRPTQANNLLVPNTGMAYILQAFQGKQVLLPKNQIGKSVLQHHYQWYDLLELQAQGSMSPEQFDTTMADVVNFLSYASEPYKAQQEKIGWWVLGYLVILFFLIYQLKKRYWRSVGRNK